MDFLDWGIAYDPSTNEINIGVHSVSHPNDETFLAVLSHEIGHSFDSCRWSAYFKGPWPFETIGQCLRSPQSVGVKKRDDSQLDLFSESNKELGLSLKENPTCNKIAYPSEGPQADQLPESLADWFSAEVLANAPKLNTTHLRSDLGETKELKQGSSYPSNRLRLDGIYFAHPKIKPASQKSLYRYCGWVADLKKE